MRKIWNWIKNNPNRTMFLVPILLVAGISISHVVSWYDIANPFNWAVYLSIAIEVGAMTALIAATNKIKGGVWFMFGLVTLIQFIGNIFYSYKEIDPNGESFKMWVELTGPIWDLFSDSTDVISMKRWLAILEGGLLPIISLTSLHFFVKYEKPEDKENEVVEKPKEEEKVEKRTFVINTENLPTKEEQEEYVKEVTEKFKQPIEFAEDTKINPLEITEDISYFDGYPVPEEDNSPKQEEIPQEETEIVEDIKIHSPKQEDDTPKLNTFDASEIIKRVESKEGNTGTTKTVEQLQRLGNKNAKSKINRID